MWSGGKWKQCLRWGGGGTKEDQQGEVFNPISILHVIIYMPLLGVCVEALLARVEISVRRMCFVSVALTVFGGRIDSSKGRCRCMRLHRFGVRIRTNLKMLFVFAFYYVCAGRGGYLWDSYWKIVYVCMYLLIAFALFLFSWASHTHTSV